ncbi:unnamed protein product [Notodromas monacha]|uniref:Calcium uniporter protein n=1 Tax=Notodromas monacha TaxID=399045 RepID=A0A7R9BVT4_9CRUS|nr:unnamed protein product [Notodromas monacha]CAG0921680.1 unnamed protein product [Notodromas monacha]
MTMLCGASGCRITSRCADLSSVRGALFGPSATGFRSRNPVVVVFRHQQRTLNQSPSGYKSVEEWGLPETVDKPVVGKAKPVVGVIYTLEGVTVHYGRGFPVITVPLPSRDERCQFTLLPISNNVGDFLRMLTLEDKGIDRAAVYTPDGVRISAMTTIEALMERDFDLVVNDVRYRVNTPEKERLSQEQMSTLSDVRNLVAQLYEGLQVEQHQLLKERTLLTRLETLKKDLEPMEKCNEEMAFKSERRTTVLTWMGLGYMAVQFGVLARLTWWEYSWDIMEPVTYFVTYGTAMAAYAYYEYLLPDVRDRQFLNYFHKYAQKHGLDVESYNALKQRQNEIEAELRRLRDPLQLKLPPRALEAPLPPGFPADILSPVRREMLQSSRDVKKVSS